MNGNPNKWTNLLLAVVIIVTLGLAPNAAFAHQPTPKTLADTRQAGMEVVQAGVTTRVSVASDGTEGNSHSGGPSISADGFFVAFDSSANNLVSGDTNGYADIFVHNRQTGQTERVSISSNGVQGDQASQDPTISADGRYVAFLSYATNLVSNDTNNKPDIFVHDIQTGTTTRVSVASDGSQANDYNYYPSISADGRFVSFSSNANNLVSGDTNGFFDVFVHDRQLNVTRRISVSSDGTEGNGGSGASSITTDSTNVYVAFASDATNLVSGGTIWEEDIFVHTFVPGSSVTGMTESVSGSSEGEIPSISNNGRYVAFEIEGISPS